MSYYRLAVLALVAPLLQACGSSPATTGPSATTTSDLGAAADAGATAKGPTITFAANWTQTVSGSLVAGQPITLAYDASRLPSCRGNTDSGGPGWTITAFYMLNGDFQGGNVAVAGQGLSNGPNPPVFTVPDGGDLAVWFQVTSVFGCEAYDSKFGANYHFHVSAPANAPAWVGDASSVVDRATCGEPPGPCYNDAVSADQPFSYDTWARQQASITQVFFDVWQAGVTDFDNPNLWKELDVEMHSRVGSSGPYTMSYVTFSAREGNNARYAVNLRPLDLLPGQNGGVLTDKSLCPTFPVTISTDGQYLQADFEFYFTVNGVELRPTGGGDFHGTFSNYLGLYAVCGFGG